MIALFVLLAHAEPIDDRVSLETDRAPEEPDRAVGSGVATIQPSAVQVANLALLARVWGFVKYHHPRVTSGKIQFDYELFRALPSILAADTADDGRAAIDAWVATLGEANGSPRSKPRDEEVMAAPVSWISDESLLGPALSARLERILAHRSSGPKQFYASRMPRVHNPSFANEEPYTFEMLADPGYRLLAVLRFWNIIAYWSPYRDLVEDWDAALPEFIARAFAVRTLDAYRKMLLELVARTRDTHANVWSALDALPPGGERQLPVTLEFVEGKAVVTGYPEGVDGRSTGLAIGDVVRSIGGEPIETLVERWRPYFCASNEPTMLRDIADRGLARGPPGNVVLEIDGPLGPRTMEVDRSAPYRAAWSTHDHKGPPFRRLSDDLAYLTLSSASAHDAAKYVLEAEGAHALVIDLRTNLSEGVAFALGSRFVDERTAFARFTQANWDSPGAFGWSRTVVLRPRAPHLDARIAILVDETTQSAGEYTAMAFRTAPGAIVVGSTTAGADGNVSEIPLPGLERAMISGIGVFYPDGTPTQRVGIVPDFEVHRTVAGVRAGRDEVWEAAVRELLGRDATDSERRALVAR